MKQKGKKRLAFLMALFCLLSLTPMHADYGCAEGQETAEAAPVEEKPTEKPKPTEVPATKEPTPKPTEVPATKEPTPKPTEVPATKEPTPKPTEVPATKEPTPKPTEVPATQAPTEKPTEVPATEAPTEKPTEVPVTQAPTEKPTEVPATQAPTEKPTEVPATQAPTEKPTEVPVTQAPTPEPTVAPTATAEPSPTPTLEPTPSPTPEAGMKMMKRSKSEWNNSLNPDKLSIPDDGMPIPLIFQYNYTTTVCTFGEDHKSVASSGCGATAASMVIAYVEEDYDQTPYTLFYWAAKNGHYSGDGLGFESIRRMLSNHGVSSSMRGVSKGNIINALKDDLPVIMKMGPGTFTDNGHYIVLRGLDAEGNVLVNDPNSESRSYKSYSVSRIVKEAKGEHMLVVTDRPESEEEEPVLQEAVKTAPEPTEFALMVPEGVPTESAPGPEATEIPDAEPENIPVEPVATEIPDAEPENIPAEPEATEIPAAEPENIPVEPEATEAPDAEPENISAEPEATEIPITVPENIPAEPETAPIVLMVPEGIPDEIVPAYNPFRDMPIAVDEPRTEYAVRVNCDCANLRILPGPSGEVAAKVYKDAQLTITGEETCAEDGYIWCAVRWEGSTLYLRSDLIAPLN